MSVYRSFAFSRVNPTETDLNRLTSIDSKELAFFISDTNVKQGRVQGVITPRKPLTTTQIARLLPNFLLTPLNAP